MCLFMSDGSSYLSFCVSSISRARLQVGISEFLCVCVCVSVLACTVITSDLFSFFPLCVSASVHCDCGGVGQRQRHAQQW